MSHRCIIIDHRLVLTSCCCYHCIMVFAGRLQHIRGHFPRTVHGRMKFQSALPMSMSRCVTALLEIVMGLSFNEARIGKSRIFGSVEKIVPVEGAGQAFTPQQDGILLQVRGDVARPVHVQKVQFSTNLEQALARLQHGQFVRAQIQHVDGVLKQGVVVVVVVVLLPVVVLVDASAAAADLLVDPMVVYCCCCCVSSSFSCCIIIVALALTSRRRCCCRRCCCRRCCCCCRRCICLVCYRIHVASLSRVVSRTGSLAYPFLSVSIQIYPDRDNLYRIQPDKRKSLSANRIYPDISVYPRIGYIR